MENSKIEWCDHSFNAWTGCSKVSPACRNCYAEGWARRTGFLKGWGPGHRRRTSPKNWLEPLKWDRAAGQRQPGLPRPRVFCNSLADWLDEEVPAEWLAELLVLVFRTGHLDWLLLSKRPENFHRRLARALDCLNDMHDAHLARAQVRGWLKEWFVPSNVWVGTTVENQEWADRRIPELRRIPARVRFLSCEPLLGEVDLGFTHGLAHGEDIADYRLDWVICGGESGPGARPMRAEWARSLRRQCADARVPYFFKQWGDHDQDGRRVGKKAAGRLLDGAEHSAFPSPEPMAAPAFSAPDL